MHAASLPRWFRWLAYGALAYSVAVILFGAYVRATGSGAGCGDHWPTCHGEVIPRAPALQTQIEFTHRVTSGIALPFVLVVAAAASRLRASRVVRVSAFAGVFFMVLEAAIGALLVKKQWVATDASLSRAVAHAAHLVNTLFLLAAQTATCVFAGNVTAPKWRGQGARLWILAGLCAGIMALGASGAIAALGDTLFPATSLASGMADEFSNTAHFLVRLRVWHPLLALATLLALGWLYATSSPGQPGIPARSALLIFSSLYAAQLVVGLVNLGLLAPIPLQLVHLFLADAVWISLVGLVLWALSEPAEAQSR
ncbi:MAG: COX15/CtaA family protein [Myxococcaceae bacterium]